MLDKKKKILSLLKLRGPSLPSSLAKEIQLSLLFTSALLSEMLSEKNIKVSHLKIGNSPLYYLPGQEGMLDKFSIHLKKKEKEAFELLKKYGILEESKLNPVHRVALRNLKDFAILLKVKHKDRDIFFWKFHTLSEEDTKKKIRKFLEVKEKEIEEIKPREKITKIEAVREIEKKLEKKKKIRRKGKKAREAIEKIKNYLQENKIEILKEIIIEKEPHFIVKIDSSLGTLNFLVVSKFKKRINDADLSLAFQKGQSIRMPVLFLTNGKLTKKALQQAKTLEGYLLIKKL